MNAKTGTEKNRLVDLWHLIEALRSDDQESSAFGYILWCIFDRTTTKLHGKSAWAFSSSSLTQLRVIHSTAQYYSVLVFLTLIVLST
jgi:hypothetical protein